jgi:lipid-binding SYLF domain-containing protein
VNSLEIRVDIESMREKNAAGARADIASWRAAKPDKFIPNSVESRHAAAAKGGSFMVRRSIFVVLCLVLAGVSTGAFALNPEQLDARSAESLKEWDAIVTNSEEVIDAAAGVLVCPKISKLGLGIGIEGGNCALQIDGKSVEYWRSSAVSFGLTAGGQTNSMVVVFMHKDALDTFRQYSRGFEVGVTGSIAVAEKGAGDRVDVGTINEPVVAWVFGQTGLMADLSLDGSTYKRVGTVEGAEVVTDPIHRFIATAQIKGRDTSLDRTATITFDIECWVTIEERAGLQSAIQTDGTAGLADALAAMPDCGVVRQPGQNVAIEYAHYVEMDDGNYRVTLGTTQPLAFAEYKQAAKNYDDNVSVIQLTLDKNRVGTGVILMGPEFSWDDNDGVGLAQRTVNPVTLSSVNYKKLD